ncbi:hypothetical protein [Cryobacterium tagatosivorans]|uniref:Glycerophosphoryl diester phosphodiesterase membrane domain-containing protein n=1 Tax=Cryobacterium tagatosivorans TaxID=1259199 RepID=A0A4R8UG47_9MICO|nr:hypothetical protein [Cryobacterium tagatosivorans]TFB53914.1 hypothetical protein E3O23_04275 [Cryobacterium tagatosivorans]
MTDPQSWLPPTSADAPAPAFGAYGPPPGGGQPPGWTPPPRPGLIPLRPLGFGTLLWAPFQVLRRNPKATFGSALIVQAAITLVTLVVVGLVTFFALGRIDSASASERDAVEAGSIAAIVLSAIVPVALSVIASALLQGIIVVEVARGTLGEKLSLGRLWRAAGRRLWPLVLWAVLLSAAVLLPAGILVGGVALLVALGGPWLGLGVALGILGGLALVAGWIWLFTKTSLAPSLIVLERLGIRRAVSRSWSLTGGYFWRTLGVQFLVATIVNVVAQIVTTPLSLLFGVAVSLVDPNAAFEAWIPSIFLYVLTIFTALGLGAVTAVIQSATTALIYIDLRMRKEGLDLDLQRYVEAAGAGRGEGLADPYLAPGA